MKKKSTSQSAFFNLRVLIGLFMALAGVSLALLATANPSRLGLVRPRIRKAAHKRSKNIILPTVAGHQPAVLRGLTVPRSTSWVSTGWRTSGPALIMIACGVAKGRQQPDTAGGSSAFSKLVQKLTAPLAYGGTDVDLITGTETSPNITQSETFTTG